LKGFKPDAVLVRVGVVPPRNATRHVLRPFVYDDLSN